MPKRQAQVQERSIERTIDWSASADIRTQAISAALAATHVIVKVQEPTAVELAQAELSEIDAAIAVATRPSILAALNADRELAVGTLALAEAEATTLQEKQAAIAEAHEAAQAFSETKRAARLDAMLAAIEAEYAPVAAPADDAPAVEETQEASRARTAGPRQLERNAAVAADPAAIERGRALLAAFDADSAKLRCTAGRAPNTRFPSLVALAPSGAGVANASDYDYAVRAVRAAMILNGWPRSDSNGATTAESKWLAARGRYAAGGTAASADRCFASGAAIALYPDGRFRLAYPGSAGVRFLKHDAGAWQAFVGVTAGAVQPTVAAEAPVAPVSTPTLPTTPSEAALAKTAQCVGCGAKNIVGHMVKCRACGRADWQAGA
jgi:hypothetical protein